MDQKIKLLVQSIGQERIKLKEKLSHHTYSKIGGLAEAFYTATSRNELTNILNVAYDLKLPFVVFGNGTKILLPNKALTGLFIKNRSNAMKVNGFKGKVGREGLGIVEALVEVDSGVSLGKLNQFLQEQSLSRFLGVSSLNATIGGSIFLDPAIQEKIASIKVWEDTDVFDIEVSGLRRATQVILSAVFKIKS